VRIAEEAAKGKVSAEVGTKIHPPLFRLIKEIK
jgi:hypothetical protein